MCTNANWLLNVDVTNLDEKMYSWAWHNWAWGENLGFRKSFEEIDHHWGKSTYPSKTQMLSSPTLKMTLHSTEMITPQKWHIKNGVSKFCVYPNPKMDWTILVPASRTHPTHARNQRCLTNPLTGCSELGRLRTLRFFGGGWQQWERTMATEWWGPRTIQFQLENIHTEAIFHIFAENNPPTVTVVNVTTYTTNTTATTIPRSPSFQHTITTAPKSPLSPLSLLVTALTLYPVTTVFARFRFWWSLFFVFNFTRFRFSESLRFLAPRNTIRC